MVVAYDSKGHLAEDVKHAGSPGHLKTYYDDVPPIDNPIPCEAPGVPELTLGSAVVVSLGMLIAFARRRRQKKV